MRTAQVALPALTLLLSLALAGDALAQRKRAARPACGIDYLPFVEGTVWKYKYAIPAEAPASQGLRLEDPEEVTIRVVEVAEKGKNAEITLEESHRELTRTTHLRCDKEGLQVDPHSFFFAGEVGGGLGMELANVEQELGASWPGKALRPGVAWQSEITADVKREAAEDSGAKHEPGRIEVEREAVVQQLEFVTSGIGDHAKAIKVEMALTGRAFVRVREKPVAMPSGRAIMWFAPGAGLVRVENRLGQGFTLAEHITP